MSTFTQSSGQSIEEAFRRFDHDNPHIYADFVARCFALIRAGKRRYSSKTILCAMRYEHDIKTSTQGEDFKINDIVTSRYARKFVREYPEHGDFFELRALRSP